MDNLEKYYLCGGVLFFLLKEATLPDGTPRDHRNGVKDDHAEPILMQDLIYTFTGIRDYGAKRDTSEYKVCSIEGSVNLPFNDIAKCTVYDNQVTDNYAVALQRMDEFVLWHINPEMKTWLVKALLDIIEKDDGIEDEAELYIKADGKPLTKAAIKKESDYDISSFLVGVLHYILRWRREKNRYSYP